MMKTPKFWDRDNSIQSKCLKPLSYIWQNQTRKRIAKKGGKVDVPVICVGNINMGGVGKTPTVIAICQMLEAENLTPFVLTRGFGGSAKTPMLVGPHHDANMVGDEAMLLSMFAQVVVSKDRYAGARLAQENGANVIVMDDGFQNPSLHKDMSIVVLDSDYGLGNGEIFPAGPLRESLQDAMLRTDAFLLIGSGTQREKLMDVIGDKPVIEANLAPVDMGVNWKDERLFAFAGIGRPEKFFKTLRDLGANLVATREFADHEVVPLKLLQRMNAEARNMNAKLITTEKDAVRLPQAFQGELLSLPVRLQVTKGDLRSEIMRYINFP